MSQYKKMMTRAGVMQKDVVQAVHRRDPRVDKSLVSKFVNDVVLPRKEQLETICDVLGCDVVDLYDQREIDLAHIPPRTEARSPRRIGRLQPHGGNRGRKGASVIRPRRDEKTRRPQQNGFRAASG